MPTRYQLAILALFASALIVASCAARTRTRTVEPELPLGDPAPVDTIVVSVSAQPTMPDNETRQVNFESAPRLPGRELGRFRLTYYWITSEADHSGAKQRQRKIYDKTCKPIAKVARSYARRLAMEGTGQLADGRVVSVSGRCRCGFSPCFFVADGSYPWGAGVRSRPLSPFRSVAVDGRRIAVGTVLYIPELDGMQMPGEKPWGDFVHDGCVVADDRGGGVRGKKIDLFVARRGYYRALYAAHKLTRITVHKGAAHCVGDAPQRAIITVLTP